MKNWRYLILSLVLSLFIHYYVTAVLMEIFGMGWYPIQFVVWCIELVVIYDALMFFTKAPLLQMGGNHSLIYYV